MEGLPNVHLSSSDILTEISVSETSPAHNLLNINLKMMPCLTAQSQLAVVNMINYVVDEIKYKIPDILCKHKNLALSSPAMKSLMTSLGWWMTERNCFQEKSICIVGDNAVVRM